MQQRAGTIPPVRVWTREEMMKRVARFAELRGFSDGLQDSMLPECFKTTYNVIGFQTPETAGQGAVNSPVGKSASENARDPDLGRLQPRLREVQARQGRAARTTTTRTRRSS